MSAVHLSPTSNDITGVLICFEFNLSGFMKYQVCILEVWLLFGFKMPSKPNPYQRVVANGLGWVDSLNRSLIYLGLDGFILEGVAHLHSGHPFTDVIWIVNQFDVT